jgi:transglutaminase-like putative cysteine protease
MRSRFQRLVLRAALAFVTAISAGAPAWAAGHVRPGPAPAWVKDEPIPAPRAERARQVSDGYYNLLNDNQDRPAPPLEVRYDRQAYKVTDRSGLEAAARIDIVFDPAVDDVVLHHVRIWRDGRAQDRLAGLNIQVLRREKDLDKGVFDGRKTAHIELPDVRVGDIVDYAYSLETVDPQLTGTFQGSVSTSWGAPTELTRYRLLWPHGAPIDIRKFAGAPDPVVTPGPDRDVYEWRVVDAAPHDKENDAPTWYDQYGRVTVSSMTSWAQVVNWSLPFYRQSEALTPAWASRVDAIARKFPDPRDRITEALRLVEDDIRYVSLSIGSGGLQPRPPAEVIRSGFGDCKDKALLLSAVLHRLGVQAVPSLTDSDRGRAMPGESPGTNDFDHAIVRVEYQGKAYWLDPTGSLEGGRFPNTAKQTYGWALPLRPGQTALEAVPPPTMPAPTLEVEERYELSRGPQPQMRIAVTSTYRGDSADSMRGKLANDSVAALEQKYLDFYAGLYPGVVREAPVQTSDNRDANVLVIREAYRVPSASLRRNRLIEAFPLKASGLTSYKAPDGERRMPYWTDYPVNERHRIVLVTPGRRPPAPEAAEIDGKAFHYTRKAERNGDTLTLTQTLISTNELVEPADLDTYRNEVDALGDDVYVAVDLTSNAGGVTGGHAKLLEVLVVGMASLVLIAAAVVALRSALTADEAWAAQALYYPVSIPKFLAMTVATAGLYPFFWRWKAWRWARRYDGQDIQPFWRTLFAIFWLWPLFDQANRRLEAKALPGWLGIAAAALFAAWSLGLGAVNAWDDAPIWLRPLLMGVFLCELPVVVVVLRLNGDAAEATAKNSRFTWHTVVALGAGLLLWVLLAIGWSA